ncbi:hypothetical protein [Fictibacillus phosphorivorans]|uniref:hypothetical protein n=1 Tax=Fictibacillus phosphorivorans TaxID=1221500 RepID=UPI00203CFA1F|nr:hypothetical protein [Fictibacillus phosphorivorans]MCM3719280.1 hypothetical protein [Fictibacillus phosphorivorans]MCM3776902.1 hypothetical protein [Fictibacillus phosphorivorans]
MKEEQKSTVTPIRTDQVTEEANTIPMKKEVQVEGADDQQQPAKIIFITSGFGKIHVPQSTNKSPMAIAA